VDFITDRFQQVGDGCAIGGTAAMPDMQWPGGIGGDELDLNALSGANSAEAVVVALFEDIADDAVPGIRSEIEIDETGTGNFDFFDLAAGFNESNDFFSQLTRLATRRFRQGHGQVAGEIPVCTVTGPLDQYVRRDLLGQVTAGLQFDDGICKYLYDLFFQCIGLIPAGCLLCRPPVQLQPSVLAFRNNTVGALLTRDAAA
jgi:hypothetical protein